MGMTQIMKPDAGQRALCGNLSPPLGQAAWLQRLAVLAGTDKRHLRLANPDPYQTNTACPAFGLTDAAVAPLVTPHSSKLRRDPRLKGGLKEVHTANRCRQRFRVSRQTHRQRWNFHPPFWDREHLFQIPISV
jgi:hypothetical protein